MNSLSHIQIFIGKLLLLLDPSPVKILPCVHHSIHIIIIFINGLSPRNKTQPVTHGIVLFATVVGKIVVDKIVVDKIVVGRMVVGKIFVGKIFVGKIVVGRAVFGPSNKPNQEENW